MAKAAKRLNAILDYMRKVKSSISMVSRPSLPSIDMRDFTSFEWFDTKIKFKCRYQKANVVSPGQGLYRK